MSKTPNAAGITNHLGLVRSSIQGEGSLVITAFTPNAKHFLDIAPQTLIEDDDNVIEAKANFRKQKMQIEFRVEAENEWFRLTNITLFIKPVATSLPG